MNEGIRSREVRVIDLEEGNLGVMDRDKAIAMAQEKGLDLIEISGDTKPPITKIMDYGKYQYEQKKKQKEIKTRQRESGGTTEVKNVQVKIGTGDNDIAMKANKATEWLNEGHRVKAELYLRGRTKYMDKKFLHERLERLLNLISVEYKVVEDFKKSPKGIIMTIEKAK